MAFCTKCGSQLPENARFCGVCGNPVIPPAQQPASHAAPAPQAASAYSAPAQPSRPVRQAPAYGAPAQPPRRPAYSDDYGWDSPPTRQARTSRHPGLLRFFCVLMALGILAAAAGFGGWLYLDRTYTSLIQESMDEAKEDIQDQIEKYREHGYGQESIDTLQAQITQMDNVKSKFIDPLKGEVEKLLAGAIAEDPRAVKGAAKDFVIRLLQNPDIIIYLLEAAPTGLPGGTATIGSVTDAIGSFYKDHRSEVDERIDTLLDGIRDSSLRQPLRKLNQEAGREFGIRWFMLQIGARSTLIMIIGGGLFLLSLILWFAFGGPSGGVSPAPAVIVAILLAALVLVSCLFLVKPIDEDALQDFLQDQSTNSQAWQESVTDLIEDARETWSSQQASLMQLVTPLAIQFQYLIP